MSVILRGMSVDCGCFGAITGGGDVGWGSIARNGVFLAASVGVMILGGGATALENIGRAAATETAEPLEGGDAARVTASPAGASS